jgi:hypothetical protein
MQIMPQERSDKTLPQKLDQLNSLPESVCFDAAAAWSKMEVRLRPKPRRKQIYYYAAACLIFVLVGVMIFNQENEAPSPIVVATVKAEDKEKIVNKEANSEPAESRTEELSYKEVEKPSKIVAGLSEDLPQPTEPEVEQNLATATLSTTPIVTEEKPVAKPAESVTAISPAKKFRIVHNNETFIERQQDVAKRSASLNTGFPLFRSTPAIEPSFEEQHAEEAMPLRRRDKPFIKSLTTLKED